MRVVGGGGAQHQQLGRLQLDPALGERVLDALVLADRPAEDDALAGIARGAGERDAAEPDRLGGDQDALRVHPVQDVLEALAFLADAVLERHLEPVDEQHVRIDRVAAHLGDLAHLDGAAVEVGVEQGHALRRPRRLLDRRGARQDQHLLGDLRGRGPDLAAGDDVAVALACTARVLMRVVSSPTSGSVTAKQAFSLPAISGGRKRCCCSLVPNTTTGCSPKMFMCTAEAPREPGARLRHRLHHDRRLGDAEPAAAVFLRHRDAEPAALGHRLVEFVRKPALGVLLQPVRVVEPRAQPRHRLADFQLLGGQGETHGQFSRARIDRGILIAGILRQTPGLGARTCRSTSPTASARMIARAPARSRSSGSTGSRIGRVRGAGGRPTRDGVVCAKVARYAERQYHPERLSVPLRRVGEKGVGRDAFAPISWDDALDEVAERLTRAAQRHGSETVWPYYYAGTMGLVQRDGHQPAAPCDALFARASDDLQRADRRRLARRGRRQARRRWRARWRNPT